MAGAERLRAMGEQVAGAGLAAHQAYLERMEQVRETGELDLHRQDAEGAVLDEIALNQHRRSAS